MKRRPDHGDTREVELSISRERMIWAPSGELVPVNVPELWTVKERFCGHCGRWVQSHDHAAALEFILSHDSGACAPPVPQA